jgi:hypothetical protein
MGDGCNSGSTLRRRFGSEGAQRRPGDQVPLKIERIVLPRHGY